MCFLEEFSQPPFVFELQSDSAVFKCEILGKRSDRIVDLSVPSAGCKASSRSVRQRHRMKRRHFRRLASTLSSLPVLKPEGIAALSSGRRRIRLWARCRSFLRSSTLSMCR